MEYPKLTTVDSDAAVVQVLMSEKMAREFERRCLGKGNTVGDTHLSGPMIFAEDDLPTYIIGIRGDFAERIGDG